MGQARLVLAQEAGPPWIETRFERVHLRNGNTIDGKLVREGQKSVVLDLRSGLIEIRRDMIERVESVCMRSLREPPPPPPPPKPETLVDKKPDAPEKAGPEEKPLNASSLPEKARNEIESIIHTWMYSPGQFRGDLSQKLEPLSAERVKYLCALLEEKPRRFPVAPLCEVLGRKREPASVPSVARLLVGSPLKEREAAVGALAQMSLPECVPALLQALEDPSPQVWRPAREGLAELGGKFPQARVVDTLLSRIEGAREKTPYALTLGALGGDDAHRGLLHLVRSGDDAVRLAAMQGLMNCLVPEDGQYIMPALRSSSVAVRQQTCALLGKAKYKPAVKELIERLGDEDYGVAVDAHRALLDITGQTLTRDINLWERWWAVSGSGETPK